MFEGGKKVKAWLEIRSLLRSKEGRHCSGKTHPITYTTPWLSLGDGTFVRSLQTYLWARAHTHTADDNHHYNRHHCQCDYCCYIWQSFHTAGHMWERQWRGSRPTHAHTKTLSLHEVPCEAWQDKALEKVIQFQLEHFLFFCRLLFYYWGVDILGDALIYLHVEC